LDFLCYARRVDNDDGGGEEDEDEEQEEEESETITWKEGEM